MGEQRELCCEKGKVISVYDKEQSLGKASPSLDSVFLGNARETLE